MATVVTIVHEPSLFYLKETPEFPNNRLPAVLYPRAISLPVPLTRLQITYLFARNNWTNAWDSGIFTYHHYHSTSHEVLGFYKGNTIIQLGGPDGERITVTAGDVLIIPAGVAHKNLGKEKQVKCIGAYPDGRDFDINKGKRGERPVTDRNIAALPIPSKDPVYGIGGGIPVLWAHIWMSH
jgi:uncharacterized protein YjlB